MLSKIVNNGILYRLLIAYIAVISTYSIGARIIAYADCPACFGNETPAPATPDENNQRPKYSVLVDLTAGDSRYRTALAMAMGAWNAAQGSTSGTEAPIGFKLYDPTPDANGNPPPLPQVMIQLGALGTNSKGEMICGRTTTLKSKNATNIEGYVITLPPEAANWTLTRIKEVIEHEIGHILGLDDVNQGCDSIMQQGSVDCKTSVHGAIEARDVGAAQKYMTDRPNCDKTRGKHSFEDAAGDGSPGGGGPPGGGCGTDPCCYDPECCGVPNCGDQWCSWVCEYNCSRYCDEIDPYTGQCTNWSGWDCELGDCHQECY